MQDCQYLATEGACIVAILFSSSERLGATIRVKIDELAGSDGAYNELFAFVCHCFRKPMELPRLSLGLKVKTGTVNVSVT